MLFLPEPNSAMEPFLRAVKANYADKGPHLIFADWLEERGDEAGRWLRQLCDDRDLWRHAWGSFPFNSPSYQYFSTRGDPDPHQTTFTALWWGQTSVTVKSYSDADRDGIVRVCGEPGFCLTVSANVGRHFPRLLVEDWWNFGISRVWSRLLPWCSRVVILADFLDPGNWHEVLGSRLAFILAIACRGGCFPGVIDIQISRTSPNAVPPGEIATALATVTSAAVSTATKAVPGAAWPSDPPMTVRVLFAGEPATPSWSLPEPWPPREGTDRSWDWDDRQFGARIDDVAGDGLAEFFRWRTNLRLGSLPGHGVCGATRYLSGSQDECKPYLWWRPPVRPVVE